MNITATYKGESVTIVDIDVNGSSVYVSYIDANSVLKISQDFFNGQDDFTTIANNVTIN